MGLQTKIIKQKIKSVKNIGKITKTMEMVSVSKMKKASERVVKGRPYSFYALELLHRLAREENLTHSFLNKKEAESKLVIIISGSKGLAGSYNANITRMVQKYLQKNEGKKIDCITIGKQAEKTSKLLCINTIKSFTDYSEKSTSEDFLPLRDIIVSKFESGDYETVDVIFTEYASATSYKSHTMQLLPIEEDIYTEALLHRHITKEEVNKRKSEYKFEPNVAQVLDVVIKELLGQAIFHSFLESVASEHSARMFAMKNANDNAEEMIEDLTLRYNQVRQGAITQELAEIVGGAAAMN